MIARMRRLLERTDDELPPRFLRYVRSLGRNGSPGAAAYPEITHAPWWDPAAFPIVDDLRREFAAIRREFETVDPADFHDECEPIPRDGCWSVLFLYERGRRNREICERLPTATAIVERHRTVRTPSGLIYFSAMAPQTAIAPHSGPTNVRLRCHLGISVPRGSGIAVNGEERAWREGECLVFDDSFPHEAWNSGETRRVVFVVDVWHPELSAEEVEALEGMDRHIFAVAANLHEYWSANDNPARGSA